MSILIKGMDMPKEGEEIIIELSKCHAAEIIPARFGGAVYGSTYPLVEVPTPHGRLIDADELEWVVPNIEDEYEHCHRIIRDAPTIIEAEESE